MNTKTSLIKLIQLWGIFFLIAVGGSIIAIDIFSSFRDFKNRAEQMRTEYIAEQKTIIKEEVDRVVAMISHEKAQSEAVTKEKIKSRVYEAYAIAQNIYQRNKAAKSKAEITQMILDALRPIRFEQQRGYYFISRLDGVTLLFPSKPEIEGINLINVQDAHKQFIAQDLITIAEQSGEGYYEYHWTKPDAEGNEFRKISFIKLFEPYDWFIGSGLYVDDIEVKLQRMIGGYVTRHRFGKHKHGYVFILNLLDIRGGKDFAVMYANANRPDLVGKYLSDDMKDARGKEFRKEFLQGLRQNGECYVDYWYKKFDNPEPSPKTSYFKLTPDRNFIVAAGVYLDDVEPEIALMQNALNRQLKTKMHYSILLIVGIIMLFLLLSNWLNRKFKNNFNLFISFFNKAAHSDQAINRDVVKFIEFDRMAKNANKMLRDKIHARQELLDEKERLFVTIRSIGDAVIATDTSGKVALMNTVAERLTGWKLAEAKGKFLSEIFTIVNSKTLEEVENPVEQVLEHKKTIDLAIHAMLIAKNGAKYQIADSAAPIQDSNGKITGVVLVFRDVTEEYKMREELRENEHFLNSIFESIQDGISILNPDLTIRHVNGVMNKWYAGNLPLEGKKCFKCYHDENKPCDPCPTLRCLESGKAKMDIVPGLPGSEVKWVELYSFPIKDDKSGKITGVVEFVRDITERRQAEEELQENKEQLELALQGADLGTWNWDIPTGYVIFNERWAAMLGYRMNEIGQDLSSWKKLMHPDDLPKVMSILTDHLEGRTSIYQAEYRLRTKSGGWRWILDTGKILTRDEQGKPVRFAGTHQDITQRKRAEEELQKMDKLKSVGTLAGGIAHDFNNILMSLFGNISIAKLELSKDHPAFKFLSEAEKSMNRATRLTNQLLTFAKGGKPIKKDIPLDELVEGTVRFDLSGSNVKPVFETSANLWLAEVDKGQMQQVFSNLTINANQAMPDGGHLYITMENEDLSDKSLLDLKPGKYIKVTVRDEGTGIDKKHLERIFDPYFTTKQAGSGLGLATTYSIVNRHGGHISVESALGKGTVFTLHLPASEARRLPEAREPAAKPFSPAQRAKGLVMDDEEMIRDIASQMLKKNGYKVQTAEGGKQAIEMYSQALDSGEPFDAVILDLTIPGGMGGEAAIKEILVLDPKAKCIVSSGYADDRIMSNYTEYGFKDIVSKPYAISQLQEVLSRVLGK
ncbi:MAG: cache domain-containing protein [Desulfobulbaceae bacterium]|nr:cache domain-containing protein [Desulfobulbaceae bacterium]